MQYNPTSKVLFVSICSLTKAGGGHDEYDRARPLLRN